MTGTNTRLCMTKYDDGTWSCTNFYHSSATPRALANGGAITSSQDTGGLLPSSLQVTIHNFTLLYTCMTYAYTHTYLHEIRGHPSANRAYHLNSRYTGLVKNLNPSFLEFTSCA